MQQSHRKFFLADGSTVICKEMDKVETPIYKNNKNIGILRLYNVLICSKLDRRLFSMNSVSASGNNWVHFKNDYIHLGIKDGPNIVMLFSSLQSIALIVGNKKGREAHDKNTTNHKKFK